MAINGTEWQSRGTSIAHQLAIHERKHTVYAHRRERWVVSGRDGAAVAGVHAGTRSPRLRRAEARVARPPDEGGNQHALRCNQPAHLMREAISMQSGRSPLHTPDEGANQHALRCNQPAHLMREAIRCNQPATHTSSIARQSACNQMQSARYLFDRAPVAYQFV